jgi:hypothetical protein
MFIVLGEGKNNGLDSKDWMLVCKRNNQQFYKNKQANKYKK